MAGFDLSKRAAALVVALVLAGVATVALMSYVRGVETRVNRANEAVEAYVAKDLIPQGTTGEQAIAQGLIVRQAVPRKLLAGGAITSLDEVNGRVAAADVLPGEQILTGRFVLPDQLSTEFLNIPEGMHAMSVEVGVPQGVSQFIQRGSRVSIVAELDAPNQGPAVVDQAGQTVENETLVKFLLQDVEVLAVGQRVVVTQTGTGDQQVQQSQDRVLLTLALDPTQAEKLALAVFQGQLYFTLLPPDAEPVQTSGQTVDTVFNE